ncbi:putative transposon Ty3-I Gag-Pol polyprotein, partial [Apostichopus japonicus]
MIAVARLVNKHTTAFSNDALDLGFCDVIPHEINVTSSTPIRLPYRRIPPTQMAEVKELLQGMLDQNIIRKSISPYASPVVLVRKKSGSLRLCIDYRQLNAITVKDSFPLPRIDETLEALGGAKYFSSLDLSHGYFQIAMHHESIPRTAFRVPWGLYEFNRMPQGLCNSPSTFQRIMELIFGDLNLSEREVKHLGHVVNADGVSVDPDKVDRIVNWPVPTNISELSSFLGLASYYRRFVPDFAKLASPLHAIAGNRGARKGKHVKPQPQFEWTPRADESFKQLKALLSTAPVLAYPDFGRVFVLEVDASLRGLGACLLQADSDGQLHPVVYASRGLRGAEKNYSDFSSFKIELLALKWAVVDKFRGYLTGAKCTVYTDNNPLAHLQTARLGATEQRWAAQLAPFNLEIKYRPGRLNKCADALSRCPSNLPPPSESCSMFPAEIVKEVTENKRADKVYPCVFPSFTYAQLSQFQQADPALQVVCAAWKSGEVPIDDDKLSIPGIKGWMKEMSKFTEHYGVMYRQGLESDDGSCRQLLVPPNLRRQLLQMTHDDWGHQGVNRTYNVLRRRCFWPGLHKDIQSHI